MGDFRVPGFDLGMWSGTGSQLHSLGQRVHLVASLSTLGVPSPKQGFSGSQGFFGIKTYIGIFGVDRKKS